MTAARREATAPAGRAERQCRGDGRRPEARLRRDAPLGRRVPQDAAVVRHSSGGVRDRLRSPRCEPSRNRLLARGAVRRERVAVEAVQVEADVAARAFVSSGTAPQVLEKAPDDVHPCRLLTHAGAALNAPSAAAVQCRAAPQGLSMLVRASAVDHGGSLHGSELQLAGGLGLDWGDVVRASPPTYHEFPQLRLFAGLLPAWRTARA